MARKKSFILYADDHRFIARLSDSQKAALLDAIFCHAQEVPLPDLDPTTEMAFSFISAQIDRDAEKWEETCRKRAEAGRKGGLARARNAELQKAKANQANQANQAESESVSESDSVPPAVDAVAAYCRERGNDIDAEKFCDYYAARGWKLGQEPMADWKAAVRSWERRARASPNAPPAADAPLADWERDWLAEMQERRKHRATA